MARGAAGEDRPLASLRSLSASACWSRTRTSVRARPRARPGERPLQPGVLPRRRAGRSRPGRPRWGGADRPLRHGDRRAGPPADRWRRQPADVVARRQAGRVRAGRRRLRRPRHRRAAGSGASCGAPGSRSGSPPLPARRSARACACSSGRSSSPSARRSPDASRSRCSATAAASPADRHRRHRRHADRAPAPAGGPRRAAGPGPPGRRRGLDGGVARRPEGAGLPPRAAPATMARGRRQDRAGRAACRPRPVRDGRGDRDDARSRRPHHLLQPLSERARRVGPRRAHRARLLRDLEPYRAAGAMDELLEAVVRGGPSPFNETEVHTRSKGVRIIVWSDTPIRDAAGEVVGTTSIGQDVTARRQAQMRFGLHLDFAHALAAARTIEEAGRGVLEAIAGAVFLRTGTFWIVAGDRLRAMAVHPPPKAGEALVERARARAWRRGRGPGVGSWGVRLGGRLHPGDPGDLGRRRRGGARGGGGRWDLAPRGRASLGDRHGQPDRAVPAPAPRRCSAARDPAGRVRLHRPARHGGRPSPSSTPRPSAPSDVHATS